ncbi:hypothetical protein GJ631_10835 [Natronomonas sp. CBA1123]|uniref:hypothetical protein n=1 Tax=Natronomonas sp. CBA1123 TaxID=2668070 RepID=UPI0012EA65DD|nr:hypothetical protein [Natronomonas sp. CBA1123]MUV87050.1 hypothetical protein [Natronomonas sp. CBA1123]
MSANEDLSDHEAAVLSYTPEQENGDGDAVADDRDSEEPVEDCDDTEDRIDALEDAVASLRNDLDETRRELAEERQQKQDLVQMVNELQRAVESDGSLDGTTTLEKYTNMTQQEREDLLSTSKRRAVEVYLHWDELAWDVNGTTMMETKARVNAKNQPSQIKYRLEQHFGEDLAWNEVYRLMKAMAKLSGGEERTNDENYTHIEGGDFEYHMESVRSTATDETRRLLKEVSR